MGKVNKTKLGLDCQSWSAQIPHSHDKPPDVFPQIRYGENYCRNAGGDEPMPWCFTTDPLIRWQHCNIPICGQCGNRKLNIFLYHEKYKKKIINNSNYI